MDWFTDSFSLIFSLFIIGFFSATETALFLIDKKQIKEIKKRFNLIGGYLEILLSNTSRLNTTIQLGKLICIILAAISAIRLIGLDFFSNLYYLLIFVLSFTVTILLFAEVLPRWLGKVYPTKIALLTSFSIYWISIFLYPIVKVITEIYKLKTGSAKPDAEELFSGETDNKLIKSDDDLSDRIETDERELIQGIVEFKNLTVREIMTPRVDITAVSTEADFEELMRIITESGHSRIPLYENSIDNIIGIIYAKDLLPFVKNPQLRANLTLKDLAREAMFVPETKYINDLLKVFQEKKMHIGIVVDEYGGTSGLISLEDILEEIVGEIRDEYDREENSIHKLDEGRYMVTGRIQIDELNAFLGADFSSPSNDYDTVGGFIFHHCGSVPQQDYFFVYNNFKFTVKEVTNNRITKILIEKLPEDAGRV